MCPITMICIIVAQDISLVRFTQLMKYPINARNKFYISINPYIHTSIYLINNQLDLTNHQDDFYDPLILLPKT